MAGSINPERDKVKPGFIVKDYVDTIQSALSELVKLGHFDILEKKTLDTTAEDSDIDRYSDIINYSDRESVYIVEVDSNTSIKGVLLKKGNYESVKKKVSFEEIVGGQPQISREEMKKSKQSIVHLVGKTSEIEKVVVKVNSSIVSVDQKKVKKSVSLDELVGVQPLNSKREIYSFKQSLMSKVSKVPKIENVKVTFNLKNNKGSKDHNLINSTVNSIGSKDLVKDQQEDQKILANKVKVPIVEKSVDKSLKDFQTELSAHSSEGIQK